MCVCSKEAARWMHPTGLASQSTNLSTVSKQVYEVDVHVQLAAGHELLSAGGLCLQSICRNYLQTWTHVAKTKKHRISSTYILMR